jgi:hypothetical protein
MRGRFVMSIDLIVGLGSLALSILFWWNAREQSASADRTLNEIRTQIIGWQNELNKTAIQMLSSSPEMVAQKTSLASSQAEADFTNSMANLVASLAQSDSKTNLEAIGTLLKHHEEIVLGKQKLGMEAATRMR